jgi:high-affinity iron transporter
MSEYFDVAIATIFARESLEAMVIIGQYRQVVIRDPQYDGPKRDTALRQIWIAAGIAGFLGAICGFCIGIPLAVTSKSFDKKIAMIVEGVSKTVAAICILQLSLKVPKWLELYPVAKKKIDVPSLHSLRFNVAWNIWREVAETGVFLIPYFLSGNNTIAIPLSGVVGVLIGIAVGLLIYVTNKYTKNKFALAFSMSFITGWLSVGLFTGGCHEFEEVWGETRKQFSFGDSTTPFWNHKKLPMALFKPFGYSQNPTILMVFAFWLWSLLAVMLHILKYLLAKRRAGALSSKKDPSEDPVETASTSNNQVSVDLEENAAQESDQIKVLPTTTESTTVSTSTPVDTGI